MFFSRHSVTWHLVWVNQTYGLRGLTIKQVCLEVCFYRKSFASSQCSSMKYDRVHWSHWPLQNWYHFLLDWGWPWQVSDISSYTAVFLSSKSCWNWMREIQVSTFAFFVNFRFGQTSMHVARVKPWDLAMKTVWTIKFQLEKARWSTFSFLSATTFITLF